MLSRFLRRLSIVSLLPLCSMQLLAQPAPMSLAEMATATRFAFVGTATSVRTLLDPSGSPITYTTFQIEVPLRGVIGSEITIKQVGGRIDGVASLLPFMRYFGKGERVVALFQQTASNSFAAPVGLSQGVWSVDRNGAVRDVEPRHYAELAVAAARNGLEIDRTAPLRLDLFTTLIREILTRPTQTEAGSKS